MSTSTLIKWMNSGKYLPKILRDFHDQKDLFKTMHYLYRDSQSVKDVPNWINGQIYVIDWFLWYMAQRGYTLQKSRKRVKFREFKSFRELQLAKPDEQQLADNSKQEEG